MSEGVILEKLETIGKEVSELHKVVLGNGEPEKGMATQFALLKNSVTTCQAKQKKRLAFQRTLFLTCIGSIVAAIISWIRGN